MLTREWRTTRLAPSLIPLILFGTRGYIYPPYHLPSDQIHVHTIPKTPHGIARVPASKGRPQIVPVGVTAGIPLSGLGSAPHKKQGVGPHPHSGPATLHRITIQRIEGLEALCH